MFRSAAALSMALLAVGVSQAQQLPLREFSSRDGLGSGTVRHIVEDSHGYLWFSTRDGLSRYDGRTFVNYSTSDGLPSPTVRYLLEAGDGTYLIATKRGIVRFDPDACESEGACGGLFETIAESPPEARVIHEDEHGTVWVGADRLYRRDPRQPEAGFQVADLGLPDDRADVVDIVPDGEGGMWIGHLRHLTRRFADGTVVSFLVDPAAGAVHGLLLEAQGKLWFAARTGLYSLRPHGVRRLRSAGINRTVEAAGSLRRYGAADGLPTPTVNDVVQTPDGRIWFSGRTAIMTLDGERVRSYTAPIRGLPRFGARAMAADSSGNLWLASNELFRFSPDAFFTYDHRNGTGESDVQSIHEGADGELYLVTASWWVSRLGDTDFEAVRANVPPDDGRLWMSPRGFLDRAGRWWILTSKAIYRFAAGPGVAHLEHADPERILNREADLAGGTPFSMFQDGAGDIWIGTRGRTGLFRVDASTDIIREEQGFPEGAPWSFAEDRSGDLWIGLYGGGLARRSAGGFEAFGAADGLSGDTGTSDLLVDRAGRLWVATTDAGLVRVDNPSAQRPRFRSFTTRDGLRSDNVRCLTEDRAGLIYVGTVRGVDRLDPESGRLRHYTKNDGLPSDFTTDAHTDRDGRVWIATRRGISRLTPGPDRTAPLRPARIDGLRLGGEPHRLPELGQRVVAAQTLGPGQNQVQVSFHAPGSGLRYQYKLEGSSEGWSEPTDRRSVDFSSLAPGRYRFLVRTVAQDGVPDASPASFAFAVLRPMWQRWWFVTAAGMLVAVGAYVLFRSRFAQALELERIRTQISTDLHDDIGSSLSQVAILSEVARRQVGADANGVGTHLAKIAGTSRELVDSMSDIVWSVDPQQDALGDLTHRMRRFASDAFTASEIEFRFDVPQRVDAVKLRADVRRQVFLVFKEGVNNAVRHSACSHAEIVLRLNPGWVELQVRDDGRGLGAGNGRHGHGLRSMRMRAESLGGTLEIDSPSGGGTRLFLRVPRSGGPAASGVG